MCIINGVLLRLIFVLAYKKSTIIYYFTMSQLVGGLMSKYFTMQISGWGTAVLLK